MAHRTRNLLAVPRICPTGKKRFETWEEGEARAQDMTQGLLNGEVIVTFPCHGHYHLAHLPGTKPFDIGSPGGRHIRLPLDARVSATEIERRARTRPRPTGVHDAR